MTELQFKPEITGHIYSQLALYQQHQNEWELTELMTWLHTWRDRLVGRFELHVETVALCVEWICKRRAGHFRHGRNGFGLLGEIAINRHHLNREPWQIIGTLFHELLHAWQEVYGKPGKGNYHNREFRQKARSYGLVIDTKGCTRYEPGSVFLRFLEEFDVSVPFIPQPTLTVAGSKLIKWSCQCEPPVNVRVAVAHFYAQCLWCGQVFRKTQ